MVPDPIPAAHQAKRRAWGRQYRQHRLAIGVALAMLPGIAHAQSTRFLSLRDSLAGLEDAATLRARIRADARGAAARIENGLIGFRIFEITGDDNDLAVARDAFEKARSDDGRNAFARYGVALTMTSEPAVRRIELAQTGRSLAKELGLDTRSKAFDEAARAVALDRTLAPAAVLLGRLALLSRDEEELDRAARALAPFLRGQPTDNEALAMYSRVLVARHEYGPAVDVAMVATRAAGASADARLALALALMHDRGTAEDGAIEYFDVIDDMTPAMADRLYQETRWIATPAEQAAWDSASLAERRTWFRDFWETRAALAGESVAERVAEHYRRLTIALSSYVRNSDGPLPGQTLTQQLSPSPFDERGVIYLRHGAPDTLIHTPMIPHELAMSSSACQLGGARQDTSRWSAEVRGGLRDTESWVYHDVDGRPRLYTFVRCAGNYPDFVLPYEIPCDGSPFQVWVTPRQFYESEIGRCDADTRERIRDYTKLALVTDSDRPDFERNVPVIFDLLAFRGPRGLTELTAPLAIALDSIGPRARLSSFFRLDMTVAVVDTVNHNLSRRDTTIAAAAATLPRAGDWLNTFVRLWAAPSGQAELRITVRDAIGQSGNFFGTTISVPDYGGDSVMVSSIVLAAPGEGGDWRRGDASLRLMPYGEFSAGSFRAYYEIYNLPDSSSYDTELTVEPWREGLLDPLRPQQEVQPIRLRFSDEARPSSDGVVRELRTVESGLPSGRYRISVVVTERETGRKASSSRPFVVPSSGR